MADERMLRISRFINADGIISILLSVFFACLCTFIILFRLDKEILWSELIPLAVLVILATTAAVFYIYHYQDQLIKNHLRALALTGLFVLLLAVTKLAILLTKNYYWATGTAVTGAIILTIAYDQRFALGMIILYCLLAGFVAGITENINLLIIMAAGSITCCFSLREIRTRMKLLEVSTVAAAIVLVTAIVLGFLNEEPDFANAGYHAAAAFLAGLLIQSLLPLIEKIFRIATSMTLLDFSDANQPLLKKLAMEATGTFSHSLLVGSIAEAGAESIGCNGLLCRVGAYYHDIGKINKPGYFIENEMGSASRHKELSPAMSQLVIAGHVKDGIELAKEYGLPVVLRQFIEAHHGTTLIEYFYNEARKKYIDEKKPAPSENEFRYKGPKPQTREAAIVMLADAVEGVVRSMPEITPAKIEVAVHNMAMKRLQDGQFDECDLTLKELSKIEASMSKTLTALSHSRIAYPMSVETQEYPDQRNNKTAKRDEGSLEPTPQGQGQ